MLKNIFNVSVTFALLLLGTSCSGGSSSSDDEGVGTSVSQQEITAFTSGGGFVDISFPIPAGTTAFQVVGFVGSGVLQPVALIDPSGQDVLGFTTQSTLQAQLNTLNPTTLNFPFLSGVVQVGTYQARYRASLPDAGQQTRFIVNSKTDADLSGGVLRVNLISVGPVANSEETRNDLEGVIGKVEGIFSQAGISLDLQWYDFDGNELLPDPRDGDSLYASISAAVRPQAVNVIFASRVRGLSADDRYGVAGASPGPISPSPRSAVVIDIIEVTGGDGEFEQESDSSDSDERPSRHNNEPRLAAEEVARGIGRYLGLEDLVQFRGSTVVRSDSLPGTESCLTEEQCEASKDARSNFMMPRPLLEDRNGVGSRRYYARDALVSQQAVVLNNHVLVN